MDDMDDPPRAFPWFFGLFGSPTGWTKTLLGNVNCELAGMRGVTGHK